MSTFETKTGKRKRKKKPRNTCPLQRPRHESVAGGTASRRPGPSTRLKGNPRASPCSALISLPWDVFADPSPPDVPIKSSGAEANFYVI